MGIQNNQQDGSNRFSSINVTPFVDVSLVLLVIFMVTAPAYLKEVMDLNLPKAESGQATQEETLGVAITAGGQILLAGELLSEEDLRIRIKNALDKNPQVQAVIAADVESRHRDLVRVMDLLKVSGLQKFAVQVQLPEGTSP